MLSYVRCVHRFLATRGHPDFVHAGEVAMVLGGAVSQVGRLLSDYARDGVFAKELTGGDGPAKYRLTRMGLDIAEKIAQGEKQNV